MVKINFSAAQCVELPSKGAYRFVECHDGTSAYMLKALKPAYASRRACKALLHKEYELVKRMDSAWLPKYYAWEEESPYGCCIVEEYVAGETLKAFCDKEANMELHTQVAHQLAEALQALHGQHCLHGNLHSNNVRVMPDHSVRLLDIRLPQADDLQLPYAMRSYLAPEQLDGTIMLDVRADIYAFGKLLCLLGLEDNYAQVASRCCALGRSERYVDMDEVIAAMENNPLGERHGKWIWGIPAALGVLGIVIYFAIQLFSSQQTATESTQPTETLVVAHDSVHTAAAAEPNQTSQTTSADKAVSLTAQSSNTPTSEGQASVSPSGFNMTAVQEQMRTQLDAVYRPYFQATHLGTLEYRVLRSQVKKCYKSFISSLGTLTQAQRDAVDAAFGGYVKQLNAPLKEQHP